MISKELFTILVKKKIFFLWLGLFKILFLIVYTHIMMYY